jgi:hypothetical protein
MTLYTLLKIDDDGIETELGMEDAETERSSLGNIRKDNC